jgi:hypothetical protein
VCNNYSFSHISKKLFEYFSHDRGNGNVTKKSEAEPLGTKDVHAWKICGVEVSFTTEDTHVMIPLPVYSNEFFALCDQVNENIAKETEANLLGTKGSNTLKNGGVEESLVSFDKFNNITMHLPSQMDFFNRAIIYYFCLLSFTISITSLYDQGNGNTAKKSKAEPLSVKDVYARKICGVEVSFATEDTYIILPLSVYSSEQFDVIIVLCVISN